MLLICRVDNHKSIKKGLSSRAKVWGVVWSPDVHVHLSVACSVYLNTFFNPLIYSFIVVYNTSWVYLYNRCPLQLRAGLAQWLLLTSKFRPCGPRAAWFDHGRCLAFWLLTSCFVVVHVIQQTFSSANTKKQWYFSWRWDNCWFVLGQVYCNVMFTVKRKLTWLSLLDLNEFVKISMTSNKSPNVHRCKSVTRWRHCNNNGFEAALEGRLNKLADVFSEF